MPVKCLRPTAELFLGFCMFTFSVNVVIIPQLIEHKTCENEYNSSICSHLEQHPVIEERVRKVSAEWMSVLPLSALLPAFFTLLMIGPISDVVGKRNTMAVPPLVYTIQSVIFVIMVRIKAPFSPGLFLLPYSLSGLIGDSAGCASLATAYISCITSRKDRTLRIAVLEATTFTSTVVAALLMGSVLTKFGFTGCFCMTGIVNIVSFLYVMFALPSERSLLPDEPQTELSSPGNNQQEADSSLHQEGGERPGHKSESWDMLKPWKCLQQISQAICPRDRRKRIAAIMVLFFIALFVNMAEIYLGVLFVKNKPFNLGPRSIGYLVADLATSRATGALVIPYVCQRFLRFKDIHIAILCFAVQTVYFLTFAFASSASTIYLLQILGIPLVAHHPVFRAMISKSVDPHQYGAAISAGEAVDVSSSLLTSLTCNQLYAVTFPIFRGFTLCVLSGMAFLGLIGAITFSVAFREEPHPVHLEEEESLLSK